MAFVSKVNFTSTRNCFVTLPCKTETGSKIQVVKIESSTGSVYSVCNSNQSIRCDGVDINGIFGEKQGLHHNQEVVITLLQNIPRCSSIHIEPATSDDWEIIELNAAHLEENILGQIRVVTEGQIFPIWIQSSLCLFVKVGRVFPVADCSLLVENTEVIVSPLPRSHRKTRTSTNIKTQNTLQAYQRPKESSVDPTSSQTNGVGFLHKIVQVLSSLSSSSGWNDDEVVGDALKRETHYFFGVLPCRVLELEKFAGVSSKYFSSRVPFSEVFVLEEYLRLKTKFDRSDFGASFLAVIKKIVFEETTEKNVKSKKASGNVKADNNLAVEKSFVVRVNVLRACDLAEATESCFRDFIIVPECLRLLLKVEVTSRVTLETFEDYKPFLLQPKQIVISPLSQLRDDFAVETLMTSAREYLRSFQSVSNVPLLLNDKEVFKCTLQDNSFEYALISFPEKNAHQDLGNSEMKFCFLSNERISRISLIVDLSNSLSDPSIGDFSTRRLQSHETLITEDNILEPGIISDIVKYLAFCCDCHARGDSHIFQFGGMLLTGPKGSGRTTLCHQLQKELQSQAKQFFVKHLDCNELSGKTFNSTKQTLLSTFNELFLRRPSLLILDNLESVASNYSKEETESSSRAMLHRQFAQLLVHIVANESLSNSYILILATSESRDKLHPVFTDKMFFTQFYQITGLKENADKVRFVKRCIADILEAVDEKSRPVDCTSETVAIPKLDACVIQDMKIIAKQVVMSALSKKKVQDDVSICDDDIATVANGYVPLQMRLSKLSSPPNVTWSDVGGLQQAKQTLIEALLWPTKYPGIFKNYPLPLRKGALLYGAPGTGKTLLASAAASECKLNLICVKGPELLSKYIGASEKAVRETFSRAKNAKPCVIFFDELDSLSPRRGHDSTGVTDRVVNQFLAELDGFEQLEGVYILAATSRPDLIDPALLRPGRLDKFLFCPMPNAKERADILKALTRNMTMSEDVDLESLASLTEDFTGADLKALLYNALLEMAHSSESGPSDPTKSNKDNTESPPPIHHCHLLSALSSTKPSLNPRDRAFYNQVYSAYRGNPKNLSMDSTGQKATLA